MYTGKGNKLDIARRKVGGILSYMQSGHMSIWERAVFFKVGNLRVPGAREKYFSYIAESAGFACAIHNLLRPTAPRVPLRVYWRHENSYPDKHKPYDN